MFFLLGVLGCVHQPLIGGVPVPRTIEYTRETWLGEIALPSAHVREEWAEPVDGPNGLTVVVTSYELSDDGTSKVISRVQHLWTRRGYGYRATLNEVGAEERWVPSQIVWPRHASIGMSWEADHQKGDERSVRSCEIVASAYCDQGLVSVCESKREGRTTVLRDHLCPGVGWGGFEALLQLPDGSTVRMWSDELVRDGQPVTIVSPK